MVRAIILAALMMFPVTHAMANTMDGIRADCASNWPGDFAMQEYCQNRQVDALRSLQAASDEPDENLRAALGQCLSNWQTENGFDFAMVAYCYDRQEQAYRRLN